MLEMPRTAIALKPTQIFLDWLHKLNPTHAEITLNDLRESASMFLLPAFEDDDQLWSCVEELAPELFGSELAVWTQDTSQWPSALDYETFTTWFDVEHFHSIIDLVDDGYSEEDEFEDFDEDDDDKITSDTPVKN